MLRLAALVLVGLTGCVRTQPGPQPIAPNDEAEPAPESPEPEPVESSSLPTLDLDVPAEHRCDVTVEAVLADEHLRGTPNTPSHQESIANLSPEDYEAHSAEEHFETYRECAYRVRVQGKQWRYVQTWSTTLDELPATWCDDAQAFIAADIQRTTEGCRDLHRGAYYGSDLVPLT
ncbi:MAG: hypothetical protein AAF721_18930, partial [Myxococcota bacterium]